MTLSLKNLFTGKRPLQKIPLEELEIDELRDLYEIEFNMKLGDAMQDKKQCLEAYRIAYRRKQNE